MSMSPPACCATSRRQVRVRPGPAALLHAQDKAIMRDRLTALGAPCPTNRVVHDAAALVAFGDHHGWPVIAKTSRGGYDGKGVWRIDSAAEPPRAVRRPLGGRTDHRRGVCRLHPRIERSGGPLAGRPSRGLSDLGIGATQRNLRRDGHPGARPVGGPGHGAQQLALTIAAELGVVGVLAVELMQRADGSIVVNELAMRLHNTGHWTIDGAYTSQFENHLRAVLDLPLGDPSARVRWTVMVNILGGTIDDLPSALLHCFARDRKLRVQLYGKKVRPGRKVGHVTAFGDDLDGTRRARHAAAYLKGDPDA